MKGFFRNWIDNIIPLVFMLALSLYFYRHTMNTFPAYVHAWSQTDRYAIAEGFTQNGFDFFHPRTWVLNPQFPADPPPEDPQGITAVDFPIHDFIPAIGMALTGSHEPWVFRLYILAYSLLGLFFLYKSVRFLGGSPFSGLVLIGLAFTLPVFTYYQNGFIPTIPSIANIFIGIYFLLKYYRDRHFRDFIIGISFFTLAALARTPFAIPLIALTGTLFLSQVRTLKIRWKEWVVLACSFALIGGYFLYNASLRAEYGSIFLSRPLPPDSASEAFGFLSRAWTKWIGVYFSIWHLLAFGFIFMLAILSQKRSINHEKEGLPGGLFVFWGLWILGAIAYMLLMVRQFPDHDYYFLDTLFIPVVILVGITLVRLDPQAPPLKWAGTILLIPLLIGMMSYSKSIQTQRRETHTWDLAYTTYQNFVGSQELLDRSGVKSDDQLLVFGGFAPNLPFILMKRSGYSYLTSRTELVAEALELPFDYVVAQDQFLLSDVVTSYPAIVDSLERVSGNGKISLFQKRKNRRNNDILEFTGLANREVFFRDSIDFETAYNSSLWKSVRPVPDPAGTGRASVIDSSDKFGVTMTLKGEQRPASGEYTLLWTGRMMAPKVPKHSYFVVSEAHDPKTTHFYERFPLSDLLPFEGQWERILFQVPVKALNHPQDQLKIYCWNPGGDVIYIDDVSIGIFSSQDQVPEGPESEEGAVPPASSAK